MSGVAGQFTLLRPLKPFMGRQYPGVKGYLASYSSSDLAITCWLYFPPENFSGAPSGMHPLEMAAPEGGALVVGHGGVDGVPAHYDYALRRLARSGWTIAAPSYRGEYGSDGKVEFARGEVDDTIECWKKLVELEGVDEKKTWLLGSSHGAMNSLLALARDEGRGIPGAVAVSGVYDVGRWVEWMKKRAGDFITDPQFRQIDMMTVEEKAERSAINFAGDIKSDVILFHGGSDTLVPCEQSESMAEKFESGGKIHYRLFIEEGEDHEYIWGPDKPGAVRMWDEALRFIERN